MLSKIKTILEESGIDGNKQIYNVVEDFSEVNKRLTVVIDALIYFTLSVFFKEANNNDIYDNRYKNINYILTSYVHVEVNNIIFDKEIGIDVIYERIINSFNNTKFPKYKGLNINIQEVTISKDNYLKIKEEYNEVFLVIKNSRDTKFAHVDKYKKTEETNMFMLLKIMLKINKEMQNLYNILDLTSFSGSTLEEEKEIKYSVDNYANMFFNFMKITNDIPETSRNKTVLELTKQFNESFEL